MWKLPYLLTQPGLGIAVGIQAALQILLISLHMYTQKHIHREYPSSCCSECVQWTCVWHTNHPQTPYYKTVYRFVHVYHWNISALCKKDCKVIAVTKKCFYSPLNTWLNSEAQGRISCKFGPGCSKRSNWDLIESYWHSTNYRHSPLAVTLLVYNYLK